jgi:hypothetical protein
MKKFVLVKKWYGMLDHKQKQSTTMPIACDPEDIFEKSSKN